MIWLIFPMYFSNYFCKSVVFPKFFVKFDVGAFERRAHASNLSTEHFITQ